MGNWVPLCTLDHSEYKIFTPGITWPNKYSHIWHDGVYIKGTLLRVATVSLLFVSSLGKQIGISTFCWAWCWKIVYPTLQHAKNQGTTIYIYVYIYIMYVYIYVLNTQHVSWPDWPCYWWLSSKYAQHFEDPFHDAILLCYPTNILARRKATQQNELHVVFTLNSHIK